jgi:hypothetical protein
VAKGVQVLVLLMMWATSLMPTGIGGGLTALVVAVLVMVAYCGLAAQPWDTSGAAQPWDTSAAPQLREYL